MVLNELPAIDGFESASASTRKAIACVAVEMIQNCERYEMLESSRSGSQYFCFTISQTQNYYCVTTSNAVQSGDAEVLENRLGMLSVLAEDAAKREYQMRIQSPWQNNTGGAGLGLIVIVRKAKELRWKFEPLADGRQLFSLTADVPST